MPPTHQAPNDWPALPTNRSVTVSSASPRSPYRRAIADAMRAPAVRWTFRISTVWSTGEAARSASPIPTRIASSKGSPGRSLRSTSRRRARVPDGSGSASSASNVSRRARGIDVSERTRSRSWRPTISSIVRAPSPASSRRTSSASARKNCTTRSGVPGNLARRSPRWVAMPDGTGVQVALPGHHAPERDHGRAREAELLGAEQRGDHDVAADLQAAVDAHPDPAAEVVPHERLLRLREPELPRDARVLDRVQRRGAGAAVAPGDVHRVRVRLGHARRRSCPPPPRSRA